MLDHLCHTFQLHEDICKDSLRDYVKRYIEGLYGSLKLGKTCKFPLVAANAWAAEECLA
jgi:hypothetical protein